MLGPSKNGRRGKNAESLSLINFSLSHLLPYFCPSPMLSGIHGDEKAKHCLAIIYPPQSVSGATEGHGPLEFGQRQLETCKITDGLSKGLHSRE